MADDTVFTPFAKAAKGNHIRLNFKDAEKCVDLCSKMLDKLDGAISEADDLAKVKGFGDADLVKNAGELADRYNFLANGGDSSLKHALQKHRAVVSDMRDTFIAAGRAYIKNEEQSSADFAKTHPHALSDYDADIKNLTQAKK